MSTAFLLLAGSLYFSLQFFKQGEVEDLLRSELNQFTIYQMPTFSKIPNSDESLKIAAGNDFPTFKHTSLSNEDKIAISQVYFPANKDLENIETNKNTIAELTPEVKNTNNASTYSYAQQKDEQTYNSGIKYVPSKPSTFKTNNNSQSNNNGIGAVSNLENTSPSFSNTFSTGFLANNSLSLTTDLSDNNSPMMIDGGSNPGDPGIPVGNGTMTLLFFLTTFLFYKVKYYEKNNIEFKIKSY